MVLRLGLSWRPTAQTVGRELFLLRWGRRARRATARSAWLGRTKQGWGWLQQLTVHFVLRASTRRDLVRHRMPRAQFAGQGPTSQEQG